MSNQLLFYTAEMSEVLQREFTEATGSSPVFKDDEGCEMLSTSYIRWLEIRIYELENRPQPQEPLEECPNCRQMVQMVDPVSPWAYCPNCHPEE